VKLAFVATLGVPPMTPPALRLKPALKGRAGKVSIHEE
jgi:hypothetical protein